MHTYLTRIARATVLTGFALASIVAIAPVAARADEQDPGVARISLLNGAVDVKRADSGDTLAAVVNAPLNAGDYLTTANDGRAELQLDDRTELRVASDTQLRFTNIDATSNTLQLAQGTVELRLFHGDGAHPEIDTPNATIRPSGNGAFRVTVDNNGNSIVTVRSGEAVIATQSTSQNIAADTSIEIDGDAQGARVEPVDLLALDSFDRFNGDRDRYEADAQSYAYVNDRFVGADDLDQYGSWQTVDGYGEVWHPHYGADWAPYHDGNWTWEPNYGWTWVSYEPWGWAPYHYGRWFYAANDGGWCWTPATQYFAPVYEPAQVAFFSFDIGGFGLNIGFGNVGWLPLGPRDTFRPWWGGGYGGYGYGGRNTTIVNVTNVTNIYNYRNFNSPGGIVAVRATNFRSGEFRRHVDVTPAQLRAADITAVRGVVPVVPTARNLAYAATAPRTERPLSPTFNRFKAGAPVAAVHPFVEQRAAVSAVAQRAYPTQATAFEREAPATRTETAVQAGRSGEREAAPIVNRSTAERTPERTGAERRPISAPAKVASPWDRFDKPAARSTASFDAPRAETTHNGSTRPETPRSETTRPESGTAVSSGREAERPSYARPDPAARPETATRPETSGTTERRAGTASPAAGTSSERASGSPWDRFNRTSTGAPSTRYAPRSTSGATSDTQERNSDAAASHRSVPVIDGSSTSQENMRASRRAPVYEGSRTESNGSAEHYFSRAATAPERSQVRDAASSRYSERASSERAPAARPAPAERAPQRSAPERSAAAAHSAPAEHANNSEDHADRAASEHKRD